MKITYLVISQAVNLDIYNALGNANNQRQESELSEIIIKRNYSVWILI